MSVTEEIKARLDIVDYIQQVVPLKKSGRYYKACCPFHSEKTPSFVVNPDTQSWRCFGACAEGGDIFSFAMKQQGWSFSETLETLGQQAGVEVRRQSPEQRQRVEYHDRLRGLLKSAAERFHLNLTENPAGSTALDYARNKRGFTDETIDRFMIGYAPPGWQNLLNELTALGYSEDDVIATGMAIRNDNGRVYDRFRNRLIIPIRDDRGRVIGFGARALDPDDNPKYLNSPQTELFDKSRTLFGLDTGKQAVRDTETAVIVEGYMDAIQAQQAGFGNVVAQMGTAMTEAQLKRIAPRWAKKVVLALDSDAAGQNATMRSLEVARQALEADYGGRMAVDIRILQIPGAKDPDDLIRETPDRWQELIDNAVPVANYVIDVETAALPQDASLPEREAVARRVLPMLLASENDLYRQENLQRLARKLRIQERDLLAWAQDQKQKEQRSAPPAPAPTPPSDEPPPLDYDAVEPPLFDDEDDLDVAAAGLDPYQASRPRSLNHTLEEHCLRLLLFDPDLIYQVNRKFRELAKEQANLLQGPLHDLDETDFQSSDYRVLMGLLRESVQQHERGVLEFLREKLDQSMHSTLELLLTDEQLVVHGRMGGRFSGDVSITWKQHERRSILPLNFPAELVDKALRLRRHRLLREREELRFLQEEATSDGNEDIIERYNYHIFETNIAFHRIEAELKVKSSNFV